LRPWPFIPLLAALCCPLACAADESITVCYNYGCASQQAVVYTEAQLREIHALLQQARDAAGEREQISLAIGRLLKWAGQQTPISADRGGNYSDHGVNGRMDCIDHSTTTTRLLKMLEARGMLRWHRVLPPKQRLRFVLFQHYSALIEEIAPPRSAPSGAADDEEEANKRRFVVDTWYFDNGHPAAVFPLEDWLNGDDPEVINE